MALTIPNTLVNGTPQDAAPVQENFEAIKTYINGAVQTELDLIPKRTGARVSRATNHVAAGAGVSTPVTWDTETSDDGGFITVPSTTFTVPSSKDGLYVVTAQIDGTSAWAAGSYLTIIAAGVIYNFDANATDFMAGTAAVWLVTTNTITVNVVNNGSTQNFTGRAVVMRVSL